jgi:hypothetical protein
MKKQSALDLRRFPGREKGARGHGGGLPCTAPKDKYEPEPLP